MMTLPSWKRTLALLRRLSLTQMSGRRSKRARKSSRNRRTSRSAVTTRKRCSAATLTPRRTCPSLAAWTAFLRKENWGEINRLKAASHPRKNVNPSFCKRLTRKAKSLRSSLMMKNEHDHTDRHYLICCSNLRSICFNHVLASRLNFTIYLSYTV